VIVAAAPKKIRVMLTPFRDGLQSSFGGKVRLRDVLPALEFAAQRAGVRHFEFGGGARFQAPYFYVGEDPFECQDAMRRAVGPDADEAEWLAAPGPEGAAERPRTGRSGDPAVPGPGPAPQVRDRRRGPAGPPCWRADRHAPDRAVRAAIRRERTDVG